MDKKLGVPSRSIPVLAMDLNDNFGYQKINGTLQLVEGTPTIGEADQSLEGYAAALMRSLCELHHIGPVATFYVIGPTCFGPGGNSKVDHIGLPVSMLAAVQTCTPLKRAGRRLQLIKSLHPRDHIPALVIFTHCLARLRPAQNRTFFFLPIEPRHSRGLQT